MRTYVALLCLLPLLCGCQVLEWVSNDAATADELYRTGVLTKEQHEALTGGGFGALLRYGIDVALIGIFGVGYHKFRGPRSTPAERNARQEAWKQRKDEKAGPA